MKYFYYLANAATVFVIFIAVAIVLVVGLGGVNGGGGGGGGGGISKQKGGRKPERKRGKNMKERTLNLTRICAKDDLVILRQRDIPTKRY